MDDALVERMAEALWQAESERAANRRRLIAWTDEGDDTRGNWVIMARAALAVAEHAIREDEREACAAMVDCGCAHKADVLAVRDENTGDRWRACGNASCGALEARAIRARKEPGT